MHMDTGASEMTRHRLGGCIWSCSRQVSGAQEGSTLRQSRLSAPLVVRIYSVDCTPQYVNSTHVRILNEGLNAVCSVYSAGCSKFLSLCHHAQPLAGHAGCMMGKRTAVNAAMQVLQLPHLWVQPIAMAIQLSTWVLGTSTFYKSAWCSQFNHALCHIFPCVDVRAQWINNLVSYDGMSV
jgi:hypothetical protein